jgi:hypothetical protein
VRERREKREERREREKRERERASETTAGGRSWEGGRRMACFFHNYLPGCMLLSP